MRRSVFAGLTEVEPGESIFEDGASFTLRNPEIIDALLRIGATTHHHDAHDALADPTTEITATFDAAGGQLPSDAPFYAGFTALDSYGGETKMGPVLAATTPPAAADVPTGPTLTVDLTAGALPPNTYYYVLTATNPSGETAASDPVAAVIPADATTARVLFTGLMDAATAAGGTGWRLYRSTNGGQLGLLGQDVTQTFTDDGQPCVDPQLTPPVFNTTGGSVLAHLTVPAAALPAGATRYRIYASPTATFDDPSLVGEWPVADAGTVHDVASFGLQPGSPPAQSTSVPGPSQVDARTEVSFLEEAVTALGISGGGSSEMPLVPASSLTRPEDPLFPFIVPRSVRWTELGEPAVGLVGMISEGQSVYRKEVYSGGNEYVAADWSGDTAAFGTNANGQMAVVGAVNTNWRIFLGNPWIDGPGTVELDYQVYNAGWTRIATEMRWAGDVNQGVRLEIDRAAGTLSLINLADGAVLGSVGAADGYTPPVADGGYGYGFLWLVARNGRIFAYDAQDSAAGYVAGAGVIDVALPVGHPFAVAGDGYPQFQAGIRVNVADVTSIEFPYFGAAKQPFSDQVLLARFAKTGADYYISSSVVLFSSNGPSATQPEDWQALGDTSGNLLNGWVDAAGEPGLSMRLLAGQTHTEVKGVLDGAAATNGRIWSTFTYPHRPLEIELYPTVLEASDGSLSTVYLRMNSANGGGVDALELAAPAVPLPAGSKLHVDLIYRCF